MEGRRSRRSHSKLSSSQLTSSQSGSGRQSSMGLHSSSQLRLMRGSRSFLGSQSSLASLSRRNLASESSRFPKPEAQILDENGEDVTPQPLLGPELMKKMSNKTFWNEPMQSSESIFHQKSGTSGGSFSQPFSSSVMEGGSTVESSMSLSGLEQPAEPPLATSPADEKREAGEGGDVGESGEEEMVITLSETETICLLDIPSSVVDDPGQTETVQKNNLLYQELLKNRPGNDRYSERGMQTIDNARKTKHIQTDPIYTTSSGAFVSCADMYDTYSAIEAAEKVKEPASDASLEELTSRAASRMAAGGLQSSLPTTAPPGTASATSASSTAIPGESTFVASVFTQSGSVANHPSSGRGLPNNQNHMVDPTQPNDHPILKAEGLLERLRLVETAVMMNYMQNKLALYRNLPTLIEHVPSTVESLTISRGHLDRLWVYACPLTRGRLVSALTWNTANSDILAVGYDSPPTRGGEPGQGLVCCWSLKNCEFPARVFHAPSGITSLSFSLLHPNLLAAGLCNGSVLLYDVRSTAHSSVLDSRDAVHRHCGPVWQVKWVLREKTLGEEARSEALISTCTDGRVLQWSIRKGFESSVLMKLKRVVVPKPPMANKKQQQSKPGKKGAKQPPPPTTDAIISQHAPGLGFDFCPTDSNIYLVCTEEGLIHKCSCSYNEQVLQTYKGHTGAVYRVRWSPFVGDVFVSCSADWSVKLWHHEHNSPLLTFSSTKTPVYDVVWSPFHSTMFGTVSETGVEVWNLDISTLDPVIHHHSHTSSPTSLSFSHNSQALLVGVASGEVGVYQLKNVPHTADENVLLSVVQDAVQELHS